jgi:hypothetical protein
MINETNLISEELARSVTDRVLSMREHFTDRGKFHTLGTQSRLTYSNIPMLRHRKTRKKQFSQQQNNNEV